MTEKVYAWVGFFSHYVTEAVESIFLFYFFFYFETSMSWPEQRSWLCFILASWTWIHPHLIRGSIARRAAVPALFSAWTTWGLCLCIIKGADPKWTGQLQLVQMWLTAPFSGDVL